MGRHCAGPSAHRTPLRWGFLAPCLQCPACRICPFAATFSKRNAFWQPFSANRVGSAHFSMAAARHSDADEWPSFVPEERPIIRALTPQSAQTISLSGPILKPSDRLLIVVSRFPVSFSSHVAEPFSEHSGHVTDVTNRSRLATMASWMERRLTLNMPVGSHPPLRVPTARMSVGAPGPGR